MPPGNRGRLSQLPMMHEDHFRQQSPPSESETKTQLQLAHGAR